MKVAVYTIAKNEAQFVARWKESAEDADVLLIADTGSTDTTVQTARNLGIRVYEISVEPWRFDDARNAALALIPSDVDYCISLDMDEILLPGWRKELELAFKKGISHPRHNYVTAWTPEGMPKTEFEGFKIHPRRGIRWLYPVHEVPAIYGGGATSECSTSISIHHHPDASKSRSQYLPMLAQAVLEDYTSPRYAFYYGRELYFQKKYLEATLELKRYLALPKATWAPERATAMRYIAEMNPIETESWLRMAIQEAPKRREAYVDLAQYFYNTQEWQQCLDMAELAISIIEKPMEFMCDENAWGARPFDLAAIAAYRLGNTKKSQTYGNLALELSPDDARLKTNLEYYNS